MVIVAENTAHGAKDRFRYSLQVTVKDHFDRIVMSKGFDEKALSPGNVDASFEANGRAMLGFLKQSRELYKLRTP